MKFPLHFFAWIFISGIITNLSCKKETSCDGCGTKNNKPPIAVAGPDQVITLPADSVLLDGRSSSDPDGIISSYLWTKISGPASFNIIKQSDSTSKVKALVAGVYLFELKATDAGGLSANDTTQVTVNPAMINNCVPSQTLIGSLSIPRGGVLIQSVGNKIVFAGGYTAGSSSGVSSRVDIYDRSNQSWLTADLSLAREAMGVITSGSKIYFAGGYYNGNLSSRIDIYDASTNSWSIAELSEARADVVAATAGNKVLFAGGHYNRKKVDIYDQSNNSWSTAALTKPMTSISFPGYYSFLQSGYISSGNKIYFAGNNISTGSNTLDVYDASSNTWSTDFISPNQFAGEMAVSLGNKIFFSGSTQGSTAPDYNYPNTLEIYDTPSNSWSSVSMSGSRAYMAGISGDGKIFWAGGFDSSWDVNGEQSLRSVNNIEIYDVNTGLHSFHDLQQPEWWVQALKTNNKIFFSYGNYTEIYDMNSHSWTICKKFLYQTLAVGSTIYQVGSDNSQVSKLEF